MERRSKLAASRRSLAPSQRLETVLEPLLTGVINFL